MSETMVSYKERTQQAAGILRVLDTAFEEINKGLTKFENRMLFINFMKKYIDRFEDDYSTYLDIDIILYKIETQQPLLNSQRFTILSYLSTVMSVTYEWSRVLEGGARR